MNVSDTQNWQMSLQWQEELKKIITSNISKKKNRGDLQRIFKESENNIWGYIR